jgi:hypothetical protein
MVHKNLCPMANHNARKPAACSQLPARQSPTPARQSPAPADQFPAPADQPPATSRRQPLAASRHALAQPVDHRSLGVTAGGIDHAAGTKRAQPQSDIEQQLAAQNGHKAIKSPRSARQTKLPTKEVKRSALGASHLPRERISAMRASGINGRHGGMEPRAQETRSIWEF